MGKEHKKNITISSNNYNINYINYDKINCSSDIELDFDEIDGDSVAYIMFTSGSTGTPKGVAITHQNIIHLINWSKKKYEIKHNDRFANISPMYFDNSVFDFYCSLFNGAALVPIKKNY